MSKFTINNPAFLAAAGNVGSAEINPFYIEALEDDTTVTFSAPAITRISTDGVEYSAAPNSTTLNAGDKLFIETDAVTDASLLADPSIFTLDKSYNAGGYMQPTYVNVEYSGTVIEGYALKSFENDTLIKDAINLIIDISELTILTNASFRGCTSLTTAPQLPATTLAESCYSHMFTDCTSLTTAPQLPATTLAKNCYGSMFAGCTSLTTAPQLPATTLAGYCYYYMFNSCTSLTTAPQLPATTLAESCYSYMFNNCTSLTTAPQLPATTLAENCYGSMFYGCTSLTTAPQLPATTLAENCYKSMFYGCTSLNEITCLAIDISASSCTSQWVYELPTTGTFIKASSMNDWPTGTSGIPTGWTVQDYVEA